MILHTRCDTRDVLFYFILSLDPSPDTVIRSIRCAKVFRDARMEVALRRGINKIIREADDKT